MEKLTETSSLPITIKVTIKLQNLHKTLGTLILTLQSTLIRIFHALTVLFAKVFMIIWKLSIYVTKLGHGVIVVMLDYVAITPLLLLQK